MYTYCPKAGVANKWLPKLESMLYISITQNIHSFIHDTTTLFGKLLHKPSLSGTNCIAGFRVCTNERTNERSRYVHTAFAHLHGSHRRLIERHRLWNCKSGDAERRCWMSPRRHELFECMKAWTPQLCLQLSLFASLHLIHR